MNDDITGKNKEVHESKAFESIDRRDFDPNALSDISEADWIPESFDALVLRVTDKLTAHHLQDVSMVDGNPNLLRVSVMVRSMVASELDAIRPNLLALWQGFNHFRNRAAELSRSEMISILGEEDSFGKSFVDTVFPMEESDGVEMLSIPKGDIRRLAAEYLAWLEVTPTNKLCQCVKSMHPEDSDKPEGTRRYRVVDPLDTCVLHSPEGKITGFFEYVFSGESEED